MSDVKLTAVSRGQGNNAALKAGTVKPTGYDLVFEEVNPLIAAFRRMVRSLEWDVCELAATTYICAKAHGARFTAIPIFLVRAFHHGSILVNRNAGIRTARDLEGKRVGVSRGYTVTTGVWARAVLASDFGVDLSKVTWVLSGDEHVAEFRPPANVVPLEAGKDMAAMLASGELVAAVGLDAEHPDIVPLVPDATEAGLRALKARGHYPINHLVVIRDDTLAAHPGVAAAVFEAFAQSKRLYVEALKAGRIAKPTEIDRLHEKVMAVTGDPLPYGIAPNRAVLEELIGQAVAQKIIPARVDVDTLFAEETRGLVG